MLQVTFPEIVRVLEEVSSTIPAAESHGCLCGALCTTSTYSFERWVEEIVPEDEELPSDGGPLGVLFADTARALRGDQMEFQPLLPDDDATLDARANALSQWCQGFLYGFGSVRPPKTEELPANVQEVLRDLMHIGQAAVDAGENGEEEEQAYAEILEYVRAGVQLIHDELAQVRMGESTIVTPSGDPRFN